MATKTLARRRKAVIAPAQISGASKLRKLMDKQQVLAKQILELMEELEDAEDARSLDAAIKRNKGKPLIPWAEAKKRLGLD